jgi:hypothetical protein
MESMQDPKSNVTNGDTEMKPSRNEMKSQSWSLLAGAGLLCALQAAQSGYAQQTAQPAIAAEHSAATPIHPSLAKAVGQPGGRETAPSEPGHEGISLHGHWVLEVKNPDGKLAARREFDNSLVIKGTATAGNSGDQLLALLLAGVVTPGDPAIAFISGNILNGTDISTLCISRLPNLTCDVFYAGGVSSLFNPAVLSTNANTTPLLTGAATWTPGLTSTAVLPAGPGTAWVLAGNFTVPGPRIVQGVQTLLSECTSSIISKGIFAQGLFGQIFVGTTPGHLADVGALSCNATQAGLPPTGETIVPIAFTYTVSTNADSPAPLTLVAGQVVTVTFTLSFS